MTDSEERNLASQVSALRATVEALQKSEERAHAARERQTAALGDVQAALASIETEIRDLRAQASEAHGTTLTVAHRIGEDAAREQGADNRRSVVALVISGLVAAWTIVEQITRNPNP